MNEYFRGWFPNLRATFIGLGRNLLAAPTEEISLTAFIAAIRFYTMLRRDSWLPAYLPDNPHRALITPLIAHIEQQGMVMKGARAVRLSRLESGWRVEIDDARRGRRSVIGDRLILAVDAPAAQALLTASPDTADQVTAIRFPKGLRSTTARLWFDCEPRKGTSGGMFTGDFNVDNFFWLHRLRPDFDEWHQSTGGSCLEMHLYGGEDIQRQSDANLLALAVTEAQRAFPEMKGHFIHGVIRRNEATQTAFRVPTRESLWVDTPFKDIYACGDWIGANTSALWMERCVITGIKAANRVISAHGLEAYPILEARKPEWFARGVIILARILRRVIAPLMFGLARWSRVGANSRKR